MNVGQAEVAALEFEGEPRVIDAHAVQNGGVEIMHMHGIFDDVVAERAAEVERVAPRALGLVVVRSAPGNARGETRSTFAPVRLQYW